MHVLSANTSNDSEENQIIALPGPRYCSFLDYALPEANLVTAYMIDRFVKS
jgi:hypothetical protein